MLADLENCPSLFIGQSYQAMLYKINNLDCFLFMVDPECVRSEPWCVIPSLS